VGVRVDVRVGVIVWVAVADGGTIVRVGGIVGEDVGVRLAQGVGVSVVIGVGDGVTVLPVTVKKMEEITPHLSLLPLP
jgi:hypothetical protein